MPSAPPSPILHTQFRDSTATATSYFVDGASMRTFSWDGRSQIAVPSSPSSSHTYQGFARSHESLSSGDDVESITNRYRDTWRSSGLVDPPSVYDPPDVPDLPTVVVSAAPELPSAPQSWEQGYDVPGPSKGGRVPSRVNTNNTVDFSRPVHVDIHSSEAEERKREVLMRNAHHHPRSPTPSSAPGPSSRPHSPSYSPVSSPRLGPAASGHGFGSRPASPASLGEQLASPYYEGSTQNQNGYGFTSPAPAVHAPAQAQAQPSAPRLVPGAEPRIDSSPSVYSNYSFYELPPTPTSTTHASPSPLSQLPLQSPISAPAHMQGHPVGPTTHGGQSRAKSPAKPDTSIALANPQTAQDFLQVGIQHHLENRLAESAAAFEKSATVGGGCGVGMLMWGLAQRHGWGCQKNEQAGFRWLRRAAELAVTDLEKGKQGDMSAVKVRLLSSICVSHMRLTGCWVWKSELVLAIYEVGQSFFQGWGVQKDKDMAVVSPLSLQGVPWRTLTTLQQYYRVAARLGDPDAQQELGYCLLNGKGCKKDKKEAAKWYRAAVRTFLSRYGTPTKLSVP